MKFNFTRQARSYLPRGVQAELERREYQAGVIVTHRSGRKTLETHSIEEACDKCAQLNQRKSYDEISTRKQAE